MYIMDMECDGLRPTKIHVLSIMSLDKGILHSTKDYDAMRKFFSTAKVLIGHNIIRFDIPILERLLGIDIECELIDTLSLSWYLEFDRNRHGLAYWGEDLGVKKPVVEDWSDLPYEVYKERCEEDVKINLLLWDKLSTKLDTLYGSDTKKILNYLSFKMDCAKEQEVSRWKLDVEKCREGLVNLSEELDIRSRVLEGHMPRVKKMTKKTRPKKPFKSDGTRSSVGERWFALLKSEGLQEDFDGEVGVVSGDKPPNVGSHKQIKDWLYSLGWKPETFKFVRNKETGDVKQIPQISLDRGGGVCNSVKKLYKKEPALDNLDGLSILSHRISILKGFMDNVSDDGYLKAEIQGLTNTMRFKHAVCVNLPGVKKPYGSLIRGCLTAPEGYELCGSDMASLEDRTKQHYMWQFDKKYVKEMMVDNFDPHFDLAVAAGALTDEQVKAHKEETEDYGDLRSIYKATNYACVYGAGADTIARAAGTSKKDAKKLIEAYWKRNWSVKAIPRTIKTKVEFGSMWLFNPVSEIWYSLRAEKDIFSTLNQGTGTYCFDTWVKHLRSKRPQLTAQFHDEVVLTVKKGHRDGCSKLLRWAINETNRDLKLNRELDIDIKYGDTYADIH